MIHHAPLINKSDHSLRVNNSNGTCRQRRRSFVVIIRLEWVDKTFLTNQLQSIQILSPPTPTAPPARAALAVAIRIPSHVGERAARTRNADCFRNKRPIFYARGYFKIYRYVFFYIMIFGLQHSHWRHHAALTQLTFRVSPTVKRWLSDWFAIF